MNRIGQKPATSNVQSNGRFGLLPPDPLARLTRREEKMRAVRKIGKWNRQIKDKRFMRKLLEEVKISKGKRRSDIHGSNDNRLVFGSKNLQATHDKNREGMSTKLATSDIRKGDRRSANVMGSNNLHTITETQSKNTTKKVKSDIRNYQRTEENGLVFGSEAYQIKMHPN